MSITVAIVGEAWEAPFVRATAHSLAQWLPPDAAVCVPSELVRSVADVYPRPVRVVAATEPGFQGYEDLRRRVLRENERGQGVLLLAAGALPLDEKPLERLGASQVLERVFEWCSPTEDAAPSVLRFQEPPHRPHAHPRHTVERVGKLDLWTIDGEGNYFQGLSRLNHAGGPPVWRQYGSSCPVFVYNTNEFDEAPIATHDDYFILGSGLLGLRMVAESKPRADARVVVYDINPDQLEWIKFVLEASDEVAELTEVTERFRTKHDHVAVRPVLTHEANNAARQRDWYRQNRDRLSYMKSNLTWEFVECDLWNDAAALLDRMRPERRLFFMYLDLFIVWRLEGEAPWVEDHAGAARSLEAAVKARTHSQVTFLPGPNSARFQLHPESPFAERRG